MPITFHAPSTGREITLPEPDDPPARRQQARARHIAQLDASPDWERVGAVVEASGDVPAAADVREWAKAEGLDVPARGKLSAELIDRYNAAHEHDQPSADPDA